MNKKEITRWEDLAFKICIGQSLGGNHDLFVQRQHSDIQE